MHDKLTKLYGGSLIAGGVAGFLYMLAFAVWGYAAIAALMLPVILLFAYLLVVSLACAATAPRDQRTAVLATAGLYLFWLLAVVAGYMHPNDELRAAAAAAAHTRRAAAAAGEP